MTSRALALAVVSFLVGACGDRGVPGVTPDPRFASEEVPWTFTYPSDWETSTERFEPNPRLKAGVLSTFAATVPYPLDRSSPSPNGTGGASAERGSSAALVKVQLLWYPADEPIPWDPPETAALTTDRGPSGWHDDAQNPGWVFRERRICLERACAWVLEWHGPDATEDVVSWLEQIAESVELDPDWNDPGATATAGPLPGGSIMFTRERPGGGCDLLTVEPDGAGLRALTATPPTCATGPVLAPGGSSVAVSIGLDDIAVIDLGTSGLRRLTHDPTTRDVSPAWSPDGSQIAFSRGPAMGPNHLFVMDADGTGVKQLTEGGGSDRNPAWSPDGRTIAFARSGNDGYEVYTMDADGSDGRAVTALAAESAPSPAWSPDGSQIALDVDGAIHVMSVDGTGLRRLSPELPRGVLDMHPSWSPDGGRIAFMRYTNDDVAAGAEEGDIWIVDADGTDASRVTHSPAIDSWPHWVPGRH